MSQSSVSYAVALESGLDSFLFSVFEADGNFTFTFRFPLAFVTCFFVTMFLRVLVFLELDFCCVPLPWS